MIYQWETILRIKIAKTSWISPFSETTLKSSLSLANFTIKLVSIHKQEIICCHVQPFIKIHNLRIWPQYFSQQNLHFVTSMGCFCLLR